ncbi:MAG TPA: trimethylamine methyltransferase family protein [Halanaerobiales bacterium]|nr:trimethylamine methyltransferase family protein [Halanaerobiales bacterium]
MITRELINNNIFTEGQLDKIHNATVEILQKNGIEILSEDARKLLEDNGAKVDGEQVFINEKMIEKALNSAPKKFTLHARNEDNSVVIGGKNTVLAPGYGAPFVMDFEEGKRRRAVYDDYIKFTKLAGYSDFIDVVGGVLVEPNDVEDEIRHALMLKAAVKHTDKCLMGSAMGAKKAKESIEMGSIFFGGMDYVKDHPIMITLINTNSPLQIDSRMSDALMVHSKFNQPIVVASLSMTGTTAPTTIAGALVQQNSEILTGIVLSQLVNPGAPVIYGSASSVVDLKTGNLAIGNPETAKMFNGTAQIARYYGLPSRGGGSLTDSLKPDAQAGYESMMNFMSAVKSGFNFILHSAGLLENYMTMSFEKFLIDDEIVGIIDNYEAGILVNEDELAKEVIMHVGSSGNFIAEQHTYDHMRDLKAPVLSSKDRYFSNIDQPTIDERANKMCKEILEDYEAPPLDKELEEKLDQYIENIKK